MLWHIARPWACDWHANQQRSTRARCFSCQHIHARVCPAAESRRGCRCAYPDDYNTSKRPPRRSSACSTLSSWPRHPGRQAAERPCKSAGTAEVHDAHDTAAAHGTATLPPARGQGWDALCARAICFVHRPGHVPFVAGKSNRCSSCHAPRAHTPAETCAPPMQPRRRIHGSSPPDDGPTLGTCTREPTALPRCTRFVEVKVLVISFIDRAHSTESPI
jgi:hypothetical protein